MGLTYSCPVCGRPCLSRLDAERHCQTSYNTRSCSHCGGSGIIIGGALSPTRNCPTCGGTGRIRL